MRLDSSKEKLCMAVKTKVAENLTQPLFSENAESEFIGWQDFESRFGTLTVGKKKDGTIWFVGNQAAKLLGYKYPKDAIRDHCKYPKLLRGEESTPLTNNPYGIKIIPESDFFRLVMRSQLPFAEEFQAWVFEEVLPSIRESGRYEPQPLTRGEIFRLAYLENMRVVEEKQVIIEHQKQALRKSASIQLKQIGQIKKAKSAIEFVDRVTDHDKDLISLSEASKILGISRPQKFNQILRDGIAFGEKDSRYHMLENRKGLRPLSKTIDNGWMRLVETPVEQVDGQVRFFQQLKVTQKGIQRLHELFDLTNLPPELGQKNKSL